MRQPFKSFLIDPVAETVTEVMTSDLQSIYKHLDVSLIDVVYFKDASRDGVFVDDEGLLKSPKAFFYINGFQCPLAGRGLVCGCDEEGDSIAPRKVTLEWLRENTVFIQKHDSGFITVAGPAFIADTIHDMMQGKRHPRHLAN